MKYGYARCSTNENKQDIGRQVRELKDAGAEQIFLEYEHGDAVVKKELSSLGLNDSIEHVDFMIGTCDLKITATDKNGEDTVIFSDGEWLI